MPLRLPALATALALGAALLAAGCGAGNSASQAVGSTLTVYAGLPLHGSSAAEGQAIENGMKLALADRGGKVGGHKVAAIYLDDTKGGHWDQAATADDARRASQDITAIGYLGDLDSGATRVSLPITNQAEMTQISPASTAVDLTRAAGGQVPERLQPSNKRTFARVVPADDVQAHAAAGWAKDLAAKRVAAVDDGGAFGKEVAIAFGDAARELGLELVPVKGKPDLVYVGGSGTAGVRELRAAAGASGGAKLMAPDAMLDPAAISQLGGLASRLYVTSAFIDPSRLPAAGKTFAGDYSDRFGERPLPAAAYGYESMAVLLDAITRAGRQGDDRQAVITAVLATRNRDSVLGTYSLDQFGDTTLSEVSGYRIRNGRPAFAAELKAPD